MATTMPKMATAIINSTSVSPVAVLGLPILVNLIGRPEEARPAVAGRSEHFCMA
jgi:hypothetical protein